MPVGTSRVLAKGPSSCHREVESMSRTSETAEQIERELAALGEDPPSAEELATAYQQRLAKQEHGG